MSNEKPKPTPRVKETPSRPAPPKAAFKRTPKDAKALLATEKRAHVKRMNEVMANSVMNLNQTIIDRLAMVFENGHRSLAAVNYIGVPMNRFQNWIIKGAKDAEKYELLSQGGNPVPVKEMSMEYRLVVRLGQAGFAFENELVQKIRNAESWQAAAFLLSKTNPEVYGDKAKVEISGTTQTLHVFTTPRELTDEEWEENQKNISDGKNVIDVEHSDAKPE